STSNGEVPINPSVAFGDSAHNRSESRVRTTLSSATNLAPRFTSSRSSEVFPAPEPPRINTPCPPISTQEAWIVRRSTLTFVRGRSSHRAAYGSARSRRCLHLERAKNFPFRHQAASPPLAGSQVSSPSFYSQRS